MRAVFWQGIAVALWAEIAQELHLSYDLVLADAQDLVAGVARVIVLMVHVAKKKDGTIDLKIIPSCTLPLTGVGVVNRIITDLAVLDVTPQGLKVVEIAPGVTREELQGKTGVPLQ